MGYDDHGDEDLDNGEDEEDDFDEFEEAEVDGPKRSKRGMFLSPSSLCPLLNIDAQ